jgi:hypothetical protein
VRLRERPLPATQRVTARLIVRGSRRTVGIMSWGRTWRARRARQIRLLPGRLTICIRMARRRKRLAVGTVHLRRVWASTPEGMRGDKGLRLSRDGCEDAVLVEAHAIRAAAVVGRLEARASDLSRVLAAVAQGTESGLPCVAGSTCRQWRSSGAALGAGGAGPCSWAAAVAVVDMDRGEEGHRGVEAPATTLEGPAAGMAVGACRDEVLEEEGGRQRSARARSAFEITKQRSTGMLSRKHT